METQYSISLHVVGSTYAYGLDPGDAPRPHLGSGDISLFLQAGGTKRTYGVTPFLQLSGTEDDLRSVAHSILDALDRSTPLNPNPKITAGADSD